MIDLTKNSSVKNCLIKVCFCKLKNLMLPRNNPLNLEVILERSFHWELYHITFSFYIIYEIIHFENLSKYVQEYS
jgi:hypothetical protein